MRESRRNSLVQLCQELLRRPSVSGREGDVACYVAQTMRTLGYDSVSVDSYGNVLGRIQFSPRGEKLLLTAQMDHVEVGDAAEWSRYPFGAFVEGGRIYGRAASDQKGALAAMILAAAFLKADREHSLAGELVVGAAVHQETFEGVASQAIGEAVSPTCVIVGESSGLALERGQRGRAEIRVDTFGKMAHSSHPECGVNAAETMAGLISFLRRNFIPGRDPFLGEGILVLTSILSSPYPNSGAVPEKCSAVFDRRLLPEETPEGVLRQVRDLIGRAAEEVPGLEAKISFPVREGKCWTGAPIRGRTFAPAWMMPEGEPFLGRLARALSDEGICTGISPRPGFGTNGCHYAAERKIPTAIFGPSRHELVHRVDEFIDVEQLEGACRGYCAMAGALLSSSCE